MDLAVSTSFMPKQQLNLPQQAVRLWSQESCSIFNNELMWLWPLILSLRKNNDLLINRCMQIQGTSKAKMEQGGSLQMEDRLQLGWSRMCVCVCVGGSGGSWWGFPLLFQQNKPSTGLFEKTPLACSSVNGLSIVSQYNTLRRFRPDGATGSYKWNTPQFDTTTIRLCCAPALLQLDGFLMKTLNFLDFFSFLES